MPEPAYCTSCGLPRPQDDGTCPACDAPAPRRLRSVPPVGTVPVVAAGTAASDLDRPTRPVARSAPTPFPATGVRASRLAIVPPVAATPVVPVPATGGADTPTSPPTPVAGAGAGAGAGPEPSPISVLAHLADAGPLPPAVVIGIAVASGVVAVAGWVALVMGPLTGQPDVVWLAMVALPVVVAALVVRPHLADDRDLTRAAAAAGLAPVVLWLAPRLVSAAHGSLTALVPFRSGSRSLGRASFGYDAGSWSPLDPTSNLRFLVLAVAVGAGVGALLGLGSPSQARRAALGAGVGGVTAVAGLVAALYLAWDQGSGTASYLAVDAGRVAWWDRDLLVPGLWLVSVVGPVVAGPLLLLPSFRGTGTATGTAGSSVGPRVAGAFVAAPIAALAAPPAHPAASRPVGHPGQVAHGVGQRRIGRTRNPWGVWFLVVLTVGFYGAYWYYKANEEVRDYEPGIRVNPLGALSAIFFGWVLCFIPCFVSWVNTGNRIAQAQQAAGRPERCSGGLGLLCALFPGGSYVYYQSQLNKVWDSYGNPPAGTPC